MERKTVGGPGLTTPECNSVGFHLSVTASERSFRSIHNTSSVHDWVYWSFWYWKNKDHLVVDCSYVLFNRGRLPVIDQYRPPTTPLVALQRETHCKRCWTLSCDASVEKGVDAKYSAFRTDLLRIGRSRRKTATVNSVVWRSAQPLVSHISNLPTWVPWNITLACEPIVYKGCIITDGILN